MTTKQFKKVMQSIADAWNEGNAKKAVDCFSDDAIYTEPPNKQFFKGKDQLFIYFGGDSGRKKQMKMSWHNLLFDEHKQIGMGEYTFEMNDKNHGVTVVEIRNNKIKMWREYQWTGNLNYDVFISHTDKDFEFTIKDLK
ncbi:MAG: nuclear transport factor 2 family protein [Patescibacteria group bacterium]